MKKVLSYGKGVLKVTVDCEYSNIGEAFVCTIEDMALSQNVERLLPIMVSIEKSLPKKKKSKVTKKKNV